MKNKTDGLQAIDKLQGELDLLCKEFTVQLQQQSTVDSQVVQELVGKHYRWLCNFWQPDQESYIGHAEFMVLGDLKPFYEVYHPQLPSFLAQSIVLFAHNNL